MEYDGDDDTSAAVASFNHMKKRFADLSTKLAAHRTLQLARGNGAGRLTLDVCFCIDASGSMRPYLRALTDPASPVLGSLCKGIRDKLRADFSSITMRLAGLAFRDIGDAVQFDSLPFAAPDETVVAPDDQDKVRLTRSWAASVVCDCQRCR